MNIHELNAHTPAHAGGDWHKLEPHLLAVASRAARFAEPFGESDLAYLLGLWHDLGKVNPEFQDYLWKCHLGEPAQSVPHAIIGAAYAYRLILKAVGTDAWPEVALPIFGHHAGLGNLGEVASRLTAWDDHCVVKRVVQLANALPPGKSAKNHATNTQREFRLRMVFSALVDADYLDTEKHFNPRKAAIRGEWTRPADLWSVFRPNQLQLMWNGRGSSAVNRIRRQIYQECVRRAKSPPGIFRLTVPTGGGKTRSGLGFALRHASLHRIHGFRRIIVALPYTSIIDQTAREYRQIFGDRLILEHHSQVATQSDERQDPQCLKHRLMAENWDHPLVVTTTVQLFESLFHNKPSRCRKLHNITKSILILDEVQTLPPELLEPTLDVLRDLVDNYGVTLVLSTATQPAFDETPYLKAFAGIEIQEIVPQPERYFNHEKMKRVEYQSVRWEQDLDELAKELCSEAAERVMVVFNTRKAALDMLERLVAKKAEGLFHLSTLLCGAHRKRLLTEIRRRLLASKKTPVRLISTQVVEAGVDLDFPLVYRALGPLDRIVQAAGRCNREGRLSKGQVVIFDYLDNRSPPGAYKIGMDDAETVLKRNQPERLHDPAIHREYFQSLFRDVDLDKYGIQSCRYNTSDGNMDFPETARRYKLIDDTVIVIVEDYEQPKSQRRLKAYLRTPSQETFRKLLPYAVNMRRDELNRGEIAACVEELKEGLYRWTGGYDSKTHRGLLGVVRDPADLIR